MQRPFLEAGKIVSTHGVRGEVNIQPWANSPEFLCSFKTLYIGVTPMTVVQARVHKNNIIVAFEGITDIDSAARLKNRIVLIDRNDAKLPAGEHFISDLIGFDAVDDETGAVLGTISEILPLTPNNVYVIKGSREILVPAVPEFVKSIDIEEGCIRFKLIEGM